MTKLTETHPLNFRTELIDEPLKDYRNPEDLMGEGGIFKQLSKALIARYLCAELDTRIEKERSNQYPELPRHRHSGHSKRTINGDFGASEIVQSPRTAPEPLTPSFSPKVRPALTGLT